MLLVVAGATGTGKSAAALDIAEALINSGHAAEIINADALQFYQGMDIGTAKLPLSERRGIPHHLLDILDVTEDASVAAYQQRARELVARISESGAVPILVGGTGLYIDAVIHRLEFPGTDPRIRLHWEHELVRRGPGALAARLRDVDAASAAAIDVSDGRRLVRALEVLDLTGRPFSEFTKWANLPWCGYQMLVLDEPQEFLAPRLAERADRMWADGLLSETAELVNRGLVRSSTAGKAIGYAQALRHIDGEYGRDEAQRETATATIQYARRQRTWFRRYAEARWMDAASVDAGSVAVGLTAD